MNEHPMPGQVLINVEQFTSSGQDTPEYVNESREVVASLEGANAVTSRTEDSLLKMDGRHKPVLDIDFPAKLIESSSEGHFHLYLDKELTWAQYEKLLITLGEIGLVEHGYVEAARRRGYTAVRLPWVRKEQPPQ